MAVNFTDDTFKTDVLDAKGLVMVDFWAEWCGPCRMLTPLIEELGEEFKDKIKVGKLNVDESPQTAAKFQIMSIPTVIIFKDGEPVEGFIGVQPKEVYSQAIEKHSK